MRGEAPIALGILGGAQVIPCARTNDYISHMCENISLIMKNILLLVYTSTARAQRRMYEIKRILSEIKCPEKLYSRDEAIISRTQYPFTENKGVYAWYFKKKPHRTISLEKCHSVERMNQTLYMLYVGIAPHSDSSARAERARSLAEH